MLGTLDSEHLGPRKVSFIERVSLAQLVRTTIPCTVWTLMSVVWLDQARSQGDVELACW